MSNHDFLKGLLLIMWKNVFILSCALQKQGKEDGDLFTGTKQQGSKETALQLW